ncbi:DUF3310 domain-containing protein [Atopobiaceae bacterium 24-176]
MDEEHIIDLRKCTLFDPVHKPSHYCHGGMEAKDVAAAFMADSGLDPVTAWWWGNGIKYLLRWPYKGQTPSERARDLKKARECLRECEKAYTAHVAAQRAKVAAMVGEVDG